MHLPEDLAPRMSWRGAHTKITAGIAPAIDVMARGASGGSTPRTSPKYAPMKRTPVGLNRNSSNRTGLTIPLISQRASPGERKNTLNRRGTRGRRATARAISPVASGCTILEYPKARRGSSSQDRPFVRSIVERVQRGSSSDAERWAPSSVASSRCACVLRTAIPRSRRGAGAPSRPHGRRAGACLTRDASQGAKGICPIRPQRPTRDSSAREGPACPRQADEARTPDVRTHQP